MPEFNNASYQANADGHCLTRNMMQWFWDNYTTSQVQRNEIYASPLLATTEQLQGLPPALIQTAEMDVLRDEGEACGRHLNVLSDVPAVQDALDQAGRELKDHLK